MKAALQHYLDQLDGPLPAADQLQLARRAAAGDTSARERLIASNLRLVVTIAKRFAKRYASRAHDLELDDLIAAGNVGLVGAADSFNPARGVSFATYAGRAITNKIRGVLRTVGVIRVPWSAAATAPASAEAARAPKANVYLERHHPATRDKTLDVDERDEVEHVLEMWRGLKPAHREVLRRRYLLGHSATRIGRDQGITRQAVEGMLSRALADLRGRLGLN